MQKKKRTHRTQTHPNLGKTHFLIGDLDGATRMDAHAEIFQKPYITKILKETQTDILAEEICRKHGLSKAMNGVVA